MGCGSSSKIIKRSIVPQNKEEEKKNQADSSIKQTDDDPASQQIVFDPAIKSSGNISENYSQGAKIGEGRNSVVRLSVHRLSETKRAIKRISKLKSAEEGGKNAFLNEVKILKMMDHPNIVKLYEFYEDDESYHMVTEYLAGGELFDYIINRGMLSESVAAQFFSQLLSAVSYCHSLGIVHRNIKPENLLLSKDGPEAILKLIDFGNSVFLEKPNKLTEKCGDKLYIAPEILKNNGYDEKCDM